MQRRECVDETFDATQCESYDLLAQASDEGFALAVLERLRKRFIAFASFPTQINSAEDWGSAVTYLQTAYPWVKNAFKRVALSYRSRKFTLVPSQLFAPSLAKQLLSTAATVNDLEEIHYFAPLKDVVMVHAIPGQLTSAWKALHSDSLFIHPDGAAIKAATGSKHKEPQALLIAKGDFITLIVTRENKLYTAIPLEAFTPEDALYYCTASLQALFNGPSDATVRVVGRGIAWPDASTPHLMHQLRSSELISKLKIYFKVTDDPLSPTGYEYSYTLDKIRSEASSLFLLAECV